MRWPIVPTIFVAAAIATMIGLGIWQLQRKGEKEELLAQLATASALPAMAWPATPVPKELPLFRKSSVNCLEVIGWRSASGKNLAGEAGFAHIAECKTAGAEGPGAQVALGWSARPDKPTWTGGIVEGVIAPDSERLIRLVASQPAAGLKQLAPPSPDSIPNNHLLYAIQWFFFALAAGIIYVFALRRKQAGHIDNKKGSESPPS